ncbi:MAG: hypothetical protein Q9164_003140 [Protoblastenia rupestris]
MPDPQTIPEANAPTIESKPQTSPKFSSEEESELLAESNAQKAEASKLFSAADYSQAISQYDKALASCPDYLEYEIAVLRSNIAACHLKLEDWKAAVEAAGAALICLERLIPQSKPKSSGNDGSTPEDQDGDKTANGEGEGDAVVEIEGDDQEAEEALKRLELSDQRKEDISRIKAKSLMRRARAKSELGGWGNLQGAEEDYKMLSTMPSLPPQDKKVVQAALRELPLKVKEAREKEMGEMMGKLKELGNGILKPFGLSTDMFKMTKDEKTGGYSMSVNQEN